KEIELAAKYQVSRPTISHAVQDLVNQGYLERRKHVGTMVRQTKIAQEFTHVIQSYDREMKQKGLTAQTQVLYFKKVKPTEDVKQDLKLKENDEVYKLTSIRTADGNIIVEDTTNFNE